MDRSDVFIGVSQQVVPTKTTGSIICTRRRPPAPTGTMKVREGRNAAGVREGAARAGWAGFPVPRRGMPARATKPTRRHSPRAPPPAPRLAVPSQTRNFS